MKRMSFLFIKYKGAMCKRWKVVDGKCMRLLKKKKKYVKLQNGKNVRVDDNDNDCTYRWKID